jgi:hypothetical protein
MILPALALYATMELASRDALIDAYNCGEQRQECGGVIYETPEHQFAYTVPITSHKPFGVVVPYLYSVPPPGGWRVVADYHNHICNTRNKMFAEFFSPADGMVNEGFHVIGYMLSGCSGNIHRFDPDERPRDVMVVHFNTGRELELPIGHISGWINIYANH